MCVDTKGYAWERPAAKSDCAILASHFPAVDFEGLLEAMSKDSAVPLTTDLVLVGALMTTEPDDLGARPVPFSAMQVNGSLKIVKLPVMDQIVEWFENTALGTDMWKNASDWCEQEVGAHVHFAMNCNCGLVPVEAYENGQWTAWKERFNRSHAHLFGRTSVERRETNSLEGLDMTSAQLMMWHRIRKCLEALPAEVSLTQQQAA